MTYLSAYFDTWVSIYKSGLVREKTLVKYQTTREWLVKLEPKISIESITRNDYQMLIKNYADSHAHKTVVDFHRQIRSCILDAIDDGVIQKDFTRKVFLGGQIPKQRNLFLEESEAKILMQAFQLENKQNLSWAHFFALLLTTGLRFSEGLALTKDNFDFKNLTVEVKQSYNYQQKGDISNRFQPTKNMASVRTIALDLKTAWILRPFIENIQHDLPIFPQLMGTGHPIVYNSTINNRLKKYCEQAGVPTITLHGLRHTHASILIANDISIQVVAKRLGHSNTITTQTTYIHLLKAAEKKANDKITSILVNW